MRFINTEIQGLMLIEPVVHGDSRGYFLESFREDIFKKHAGDIIWVQENESMSGKGVLRGLHYQRGDFAQTKLVRVITGNVIDVVVDLRQDSKTFGKHLSFELSGDNKKQLLIPKGFAHGFVVLSENAIFSYKVDNYYNKESESGVRYDDRELNIDWGIPQNQMKLSEKDLQLPNLNNAEIF